jgi:hypothetical protein
MPSPRRTRATLLLVALALIVIIYISSAPASTRSSPFYTRTRDALAHREAEEAGGAILESDDVAVKMRLREAAEKAKLSADKKGEEFHGGEVKEKGERIKEAVEAKEKEKQKVVKGDGVTVEEHQAEMELNYILKRSPSTLQLD